MVEKTKLQITLDDLKTDLESCYERDSISSIVVIEKRKAVRFVIHLEHNEIWPDHPRAGEEIHLNVAIPCELVVQDEDFVLLHSPKPAYISKSSYWYSGAEVTLNKNIKLEIDTDGIMLKPLEFNINMFINSKVIDNKFHNDFVFTNLNK